MGMNYYLRRNVCKECGHPERELHIGKSSFGWTFSFQAHDDPFIHSAKDWKREIEIGKIFDEDGKESTIKEFWDMVEHKKKEPNNHAKEYPNGCWIDDEGNSFSSHDFC